MTDQQLPTDHPSASCHTCLDYLDYRLGVLPDLIVDAARRQRRPAVAVFEEYMLGAHQRHLDGQPLRPGGPTRITAPSVGRIAALATLLALGTPEEDR